MTYIQIINAVLRRLREDVVSTPTESTYSQLIGDLVNETKREVEAAWNWTGLRQAVYFDADETNTTVTVASLIPGWRFIDPCKGIKMFSEAGADLGYIHPSPSTQQGWDKSFALLKGESRGQPRTYIHSGTTDAAGATFTLYPYPDSTGYAFYAHAHVPQADLSAGSDVLTVPSMPVVLGTYAAAIAERGEDAGTSADRAHAKYMLALNDAISTDESTTVGEMTWYV